jgi:peptidoglycan/LPS O-acetylase OafA/YrhL
MSADSSRDLLRALAIVLVVNCHATGNYGSPEPYRVLQLGGRGVDLFFVLSGWLLGRQLMLELRDTGRVDLRRFWYRRWLRTLPAYYAVLAFTIVWQLARGKPAVHWPYLVFGQTYLTEMPYFGISWSLCVEEHFYLLVAPTLWLLWRSRTARLLIPILLTLPAVCRLLGWYNHDVETHVRYDPCAMGVVLAAVSVAVPRVWTLLARWAPPLALLGFVGAGGEVARLLCADVGWSNPGLVVWTLIFGSWVFLATARPNWAVGRLPGIRYMADRSYAVYLLHIEALAVVRRIEGLSFGVFLLLTWALTLLIAEVLYRLVERPGMRLRERFGASRSRSTPPAKVGK